MRSSDDGHDRRQDWAINGRFLTQRMTGVQRYASEIVASLDEMCSEDDDVARRVGFRLVLPPGAIATPTLSQIDVCQTKFGSVMPGTNSFCLGMRRPAFSALEISVRCWREITSYAFMTPMPLSNRKAIRAPSAWLIGRCFR